ncbi:hypothetical protein BT69DRAFT_1278000 [Atractiella rhizophila]|nr:hypothetical protein BT69DRAFT_1278000 [Atractiella rhizophila]
MDLDELVFLEQSFTSAGHASGLSDGRRKGLQKGRSLGFQEGFPIYSELGYYDGWSSLMLLVAPEGGKERTRLESMRRKVEEGLELIERMRAEVEEGRESAEVAWNEILGVLRAKYKVLEGSLRLKLPVEESE